ncbi:MAG: hypothetical protein QNK89_02680 [Lacinutrix sp.]|uniref:hypothetical protein n=1 Tax=Lacinutrix sp. TaxID=1937692 RepID=UPI0030A9DF1B
MPANKFGYGFPMEFITIPLKRKEVINKRSNYKIKLINDDRLSALLEESNSFEYFKIGDFNYDKIGEGDISIIKTNKEFTVINRDTLEFRFEKKDKSKWIIYSKSEQNIPGFNVGRSKK